MKDCILDDFQDIVSESLIRHKSIIDIMSKLQESQARISRAIAKSVTSCGCIKIDATKQHIPFEKSDDITLDDIDKFMDSHVRGNLCSHCNEIIEKEIGNYMYYLASLCNTLDLNLYDILLKEYNDVNMLGKFHMR